ncbi:MAG: rubredoxin, partial [Candidatus Hydrogenedentota bacterium]
GYDWLSLGAFQEMLDGFPKALHYSVGISDTAQSYLPSHAGDLMFIASSVPWYWRIAIRGMDRKIRYLPWAIPSASAHALACALDVETGARGRLSPENVTALITSEFDQDVIEIEDDPSSTLTDADTIMGIQPMATGDGKCLSVYPDDGKLSAQFLLELCLLAKADHIGMIALTHYRSLLVPNLPSSQVTRWRQLIGRFRIPMYPPEIASRCIVGDTAEARGLARSILEALLQERCHASGLSLSFLATEDCGEASIRVTPAKRRFSWLHRMRPLYDVAMARDVHDREARIQREYVSLSVKQVTDELKGFIERYNVDGVVSMPTAESASSSKAKSVCACTQCGTHYDAAYGDPMGGIDEGTQFEALPESWQCPVCESPKPAYSLQF